MQYRPITYSESKQRKDKGNSFNAFIKNMEQAYEKAGDDKEKQANALNEAFKQLMTFSDISKTEVFIDHFNTRFKIKKYTLTSILKSYQRQNGDDEKEKEQVMPEVTRLENFISDHYEVRYNVVLNEYEYRPRKDKAEWVEFDPYVILRRCRKMHFNVGKQTIIETIKSDFTPKYNPIVQYFTSLVWDGKDHISELCKYVFVDDIDRERFNRHFRKMFIRAIAGALGRSFNKRAMVFIGGQDAGKSYFMRWLCPPELKKYMTENIDFSNKDGLVALASNFWVLLDEMANLSKNNINVVKAQMSRDKIKARLPYDARDSFLHRRCTFIGNTNDPLFLEDMTGNVRWICFRLVGSGFNWDYSKKIDINQVWAQAYTLLNNSAEMYDMTKQELQENEEMNMQFMKSTIEMDLIQEHFQKAEKSEEDAEFMTSTDIVEALMSMSKINLSPVAIGKALNAMKYPRDHKKRESGIVTYGYYVRKRT